MSPKFKTSRPWTRCDSCARCEYNDILRATGWSCKHCQQYLTPYKSAALATGRGSTGARSNIEPEFSIASLTKYVEANAGSAKGEAAANLLSVAAADKQEAIEAPVRRARQKLERAEKLCLKAVSRQAELESELDEAKEAVKKAADDKVSAERELQEAGKQMQAQLDGGKLGASPPAPQVVQLSWLLDPRSAEQIIYDLGADLELGVDECTQEDRQLLDNIKRAAMAEVAKLLQGSLGGVAARIKTFREDQARTIATAREAQILKKRKVIDAPKEAVETQGPRQASGSQPPEATTKTSPDVGKLVSPRPAKGLSEAAVKDHTASLLRAYKEAEMRQEEKEEAACL